MYKKLTLLLLAIVLFSCASGDFVEVEKFYPEGKADLLTNIKIEFNKDLAPSDTLDKWSDEQFVEFTPAINGKFKWLDKRTLIFSPSNPLKPIELYTANVTSKVLFNTGLQSEFEEYSFITPDFEVLGADFFWDFNKQTNSVIVKSNLKFNYKVNPALVKDYLHVTLDNVEAREINVVTSSVSETIAFEILDVGVAEKRQNIEVSVKSGLMSVVGKKGLADTREFDYQLPPLKRLSITGVNASANGSSTIINVNTSQKAELKSIKNFIEIEPAYEYKVTVLENRFILTLSTSKLDPVTVKIKKGLKSEFGGELEYDFVQQVSFGELRPTLSFTDKNSKYLLKDGFGNVELSSINNKGIEVNVQKVFLNNLVHFLNNHTYTYKWINDNKNYYVGSFGKDVFSYKVNLKKNRNSIETVNLNLDTLAGYNKHKGIFVISANSTSKRWINDDKIIVITDLGIIAKQSGNQFYVFVNSLKSTEPVIDAEVQVISKTNQVMLTARTDQNGVVEFENIKDVLDEFNPVLVMVKKGDDLNYIDLRETKVELSRYDVSGYEAYSPGINTFIYSARNLYRPGEKISISGIVRDDKINNISNVPVILSVYNPSGNKVVNMKQELNEEGSFDISFDIPDYYSTGNYRAELSDGADNIIGSYKFGIEEFVPDKIRAVIKSDKEIYSDNTTIKFDVNAEFLFGAPAGELKYKAELNLIHTNYYSSKYREYDFSATGNSEGTDNLFSDGNLNEDGAANISFDIPSYYGRQKVVKAVLFLTIFDITGRPLNRVKSVNIYPRDVYVGIKGDSYYYDENQDVKFDVVALNKEGTIAKGSEVRAELYRIKWANVLKQDYRKNYYYASERTSEKIDEKNITIGSTPETISYRTSESGKYEVRLYYGNSSDYVSKSFYVYGWSSGSVASFDVDREGRVDIVPDKASYQPGETAKLLIKAPFDGMVLLTLERNGVYDYQYQKLENNSAEVEFLINDEHLPNVYISATLFKKHREDNFPLVVAHGVKNLTVEKPQNRIKLAIDAPEIIKPNRNVKVSVNTGLGSDVYVTLAAVDEGILSINDFATPDPHSLFYAKKKLSVESYDLYHLLLPEIFDYQSSTGGDALAAQLKKRTNPVKNKRFKLVSYWSGINKTDASGKAEFTVNVPQFNGEIRLMAVAYKGKKFGGVASPLKVREDVIIEPELPRVMTIGDTLTSVVTLVNTTSKTKSVNLKLEATGNIRLIKQSENSVKIEPNSTLSIFGKYTDNGEPGVGDVIYKLSGDAKSYREESIAVRPASPLVTMSKTGVLKAGESREIVIPGDFIESTRNSKITVSTLPVTEYSDQLNKLLQYPYGCLEQTVSKVFPLLYFDDIAKSLNPDMFVNNPSVYYVKEALHKIRNLQLPGGGLGFWTSSTKANEWASVYAAHFALEAKKAGFIIDDVFMNSLMKYVDDISKERSLSEYRYYENGSIKIKNIANKAVLYALYVKALNGEADIASMNYYKNRIQLLTNDVLYLLAGSYALAGDMKSYSEILPYEFNVENSVRESGLFFNSPVRGTAIALNVLAENDPENLQIPVILKYLGGNKENIRSTQDRAWVFLALGKLARKNAGNNIMVSVYDAENNLLGKFDSKSANNFGSVVNSDKVTIKVEGKGRVYYFLNSEGISKTADVEESDNLISIRREFVDYRTGRKIRDTFTQGQLVKVRIKVKNSLGELDNLVITDMIPSAFEIENPRLAKENRSNKSSLYVEHEDIRDDRLILFTSMSNKTEKEYEYLVRVVNSGSFVLPAISVESMYNPEISSINGYGKIKVEK